MSQIAALQQRLRTFSEERDWDRFHDPKNLVMLLASEVGELVAEYRWVASTDADAHATNPINRERVENEIGDVGIALLLLCARVGVDLTRAIETKIEINGRNYPADATRGKADRR